jgi:hypothetical protein
MGADTQMHLKFRKVGSDGYETAMQWPAVTTLLSVWPCLGKAALGQSIHSRWLGSQLAGWWFSHM